MKNKGEQRKRTVNENSMSAPPNRIEIGENSDFFFFIDLRIKPNTRGCFAFGEFSAVCGGNPVAGLLSGDSALEPKFGSWDFPLAAKNTKIAKNQ